ncbi:MAG TPA: hypothetical protein VE631_10820 [Alphaproteobacteria bacterium]|nr:hypothetical protein [Alphaproteobacteria bacterium]
MGGLAHYFEDAGVATTQVSLIREHTERIRPPRALWVPFELGRPLGAPGDAAFQARVLRAALALLEREDGPALLEDFPEDAPVTAMGEGEGEGWACPVALPPPPVDLAAGGGFQAALHEELGRLTPWYDMAAKARGRTAVGLSPLSPEACVDFLCRFLDDELPENPQPELRLSEALKFAVDDLKAFYREAAAAQPGANTGQQVNDWLYGETVLGRALFALRPKLIALADTRGDPFFATFAHVLLVPRAAQHLAPPG